jgi:hypothetical protein
MDRILLYIVWVILRLGIIRLGIIQLVLVLVNSIDIFLPGTTGNDGGRPVVSPSNLKRRYRFYATFGLMAPCYPNSIPVIRDGRDD